MGRCKPWFWANHPRHWRSGWHVGENLDKTCLTRSGKASITWHLLLTGDTVMWTIRSRHVSRGIEELLIVDPQASSVQWYRRDGHEMASVPEGELLGITGADLTASIDWPSVV